MITPYGEIPDRLAKDMSLAEQHEWLRHRVARRTVIKGLAAGTAGLVMPSLWMRPAMADDATIVRGRHLAYGTDPRTEMIVGFAVDSSFATARVKATASGGSTVSEDAAVNMVRGSAARYCHATLSGLAAGTTYGYKVLLDGQVKSAGSFTTAPRGPTPFRFTAFGDQATGAVSTQMASRMDTLNPLLHLMCGDLCYADSTGKGGPGDAFKPARWDTWLNMNDAVAGRLAWMSVPGNHEMEPGYPLHGYGGFLGRVWPGGSSPLSVPVATTFRIGSVGFVGLDSNDVSYEIPANRGWTAGAQTTWLEATLSQMRAPGSGLDFVVVFMHHGPYSTSNSHASEGGVREAWVPLFDRYNVDLVISGHNHLYERTLPLRGGQVTSQSSGTVDSSQGTTYVTAGGGGAAFGADPLFIPYTDKTRVNVEGGPTVETEQWSIGTKTGDHAVLCVDVTPSSAGTRPTMTLRAIDAAGTQVDQAVLSRPAAAGGPGQTPWLVGGSAATAVAIGGAAAVIGIRRRRGQPAVVPTESGLLSPVEKG